MRFTERLWVGKVLVLSRPLGSWPVDATVRTIYALSDRVTVLTTGLTSSLVIYLASSLTSTTL